MAKAKRHTIPQAGPAAQPVEYPMKREFREPDWKRLPGYRNVSKKDWESALWQRRNSVKNLKELKAAFGDFLSDELIADIEADQQKRATMSILVPPQMINTMDERDLLLDPVRRYTLPALSDRDPEWPNHPMASRDSLHEAEMWAVEGLTHRYPTKVLAELLSTCPQYCGHCTRMDLVGNNVPQVQKFGFNDPPKTRYEKILDYLRKWYMLGWAFGDLMRDRVTLCLPDDHDVYQGNIWGNGGNRTTIRDHARGGYAMPAEIRIIRLILAISAGPAAESGWLSLEAPLY